jgi:hypothetical protein
VVPNISVLGVANIGTAVVTPLAFNLGVAKLLVKDGVANLRVEQLETECGRDEQKGCPSFHVPDE